MYVYNYRSIMGNYYLFFVNEIPRAYDTYVAFPKGTRSILYKKGHLATFDQVSLGVLHVSTKEYNVLKNNLTILNRK